MATPTAMMATRIDYDTSQDGKRRYQIIHFSNAHRLPNPYFLPEYNPNRPGPPPRTIYDVCDEANPDIQYYWASLPRDPYFSPSEKARKHGARTIHDVTGQRYRTVLVAILPPEIERPKANGNKAATPNAALTPGPLYHQAAFSNTFDIDSNPLWMHSQPQECTGSTSKEERCSLPGNAMNTSQDSSLLTTPPALPGTFPYPGEQNGPPLADFPPIGEYLAQTMDVSLDVDMDDLLFATDVSTPDFSPPFRSDAPPPPSFTPTADDWVAHMNDPAFADKYERGEFIHEILKEDNLTFDRVDSNAAYPSCPSSSMSYPYFSIPQVQENGQASSNDLGLMLRLLKLFLEETYTRPARVEELNPLELKCITVLSDKFRGGLPHSAAVQACAQASGLSTRRVIAHFFTLNPEPFLPLLSPDWHRLTPLDRESREYHFMAEAEAMASADFAPVDAQAFEEAERRWQESQAQATS